MNYQNTIIRPADLCQKLAISRSTLARWENRSDFPKKIKLGPATIGWRLTDIEAWISAKQIRSGEKK